MSPSEAPRDDRQRGVLLIAASIVAAIRLRGETITNSPKVIATIHDSIKLVHMILQRTSGIRAVISAQQLVDADSLAAALHFIHYNFARIHKTLRITPAMAAGISDHVWNLEEVAS